MPFVTRNELGRIRSVSLEPSADASELPADSPELMEFMGTLLGQGTLLQSDLRLVRVLEDLINLLIDREVILFTDLPLAAQDKLMERRSMRQSLGGLDLLGGDADEETL
ncbi:MAG: hypothetical protein AB1591_13070 [Pseudomonadota bacterium]